MKTLFITLFTVIATYSLAQVPNYVPTNGLIGWWSFNNNATDDSGNGNNLTNNGVTFDSDIIRGQIAQFNGNSWLEKGSSLINSLSPISISFWIKTSSSSALDIVGQACGSDCGDDIRVQVNAAQCNQTGLSFKSPAHFATAPGAINNDTWHHCVLVMGENNNYSYSNFKFYIDGVNIIIGPTQCGHNWGGWTYNPNNTYNFKIGKGGSLGVNMLGSLDDIGIWTTALSVCEIKKLYNEQLGSISDQVSCEPVLWNGVTYAQSGTYSYQTVDSQGCDSTSTLNLIVNSASNSTQNQSAIDSYVWPVNGITYTQSGTYIDTLINLSGCDSIVTLNLELDYTGLQTIDKSVYKIYPNPAQNELKVLGPGTALIEFEIYNTIGQLLSNGFTSENICVKELPKGLYYIKLEDTSLPFIKD
jgi:hypothetical protein